ncbi:MAG TPA: hypothetical protein VN207_09195 [Ktedonobacteraceae bacterium]|nr:hypothetical protein [Ktedonobacteraceae bacterium]
MPAGPGGAPRTYSEESLLLIGLLRTLWRLSYQDMHDWLKDWPVLALACGLPLDKDGTIRIRNGIERLFGRVFLFFHLQRPPLVGWSAVASQVALAYTASIIVGLAAQQAGRPDLIRSPKCVLAHLWQGDTDL